jgi:hypothetical protein
LRLIDAEVEMMWADLGDSFSDDEHKEGKAGE